VEIRPSLLDQTDFSKANLENMIPLRLEPLPPVSTLKAS
jgi:hypothetical protein